MLRYVIYQNDPDALFLVLSNALLGTFCVYSEIMFTIISFFQKLMKVGGIKAGGADGKFFKKLISGRADDYSALESI